MKRFVNAWYEFMHHQMGAITRSRTIAKQRKYKHIEIQNEFIRLEEARKQERFRLLTLKKNILSGRLLTQQKLLEKLSQVPTPSPTSNITSDPDSPPSPRTSLEHLVSELTKDVMTV